MISLGVTTQPTDNPHHHKKERLSLFSLAELGGQNQGCDCDRDQGGVQDKIGILGLGDNEENLELTAKHEEKVKLQQRDIHLVGEVSALHLQICADVFVDGPGELGPQFPCKENHTHCPDTQDDRHNDKFDPVYLQQVVGEGVVLDHTADG